MRNVQSVDFVLVLVGLIGPLIVLAAIALGVDAMDALGPLVVVLVVCGLVAALT
jgi:hypothetical protein